MILNGDPSYRQEAWGIVRPLSPSCGESSVQGGPSQGGGPPRQRETALCPVLFTGSRQDPMVPVPLLPAKRPYDARAAPGRSSAAVIWVTPFVFLVPCMLMVGLCRLLRPVHKDDFERYLRGLAELLEKSLESAVAFWGAEKTNQLCAPSPRARAGHRPGGTAGPVQPPGARHSRRHARIRR